MTGVLNRNLRSQPPTVVAGDGLWVTTADGKRFLDAVSGGAAVSCLGHGNRRVEQAIADQLKRIAYFHTSFFTSDPAERLAEDLLRDAPAGLSEVLFCSGGSEAMESALKLTRQYWVEKGEPQRTKVISRRQSYHGSTLGALSIGGNVARRELYTPFLFSATLIEPCYAYRHQQADEGQEAYGLRAADELATAIESLGPDNVAAFVAEPVVGATLGCAPAVAGYFRRIREICDRYGILLILDEVMCGLGRVGERYACAHDGVVPDLLTLAKGLGGGYQPIGAVMAHERVIAAIRDHGGTLKHGFTYMAHPVACAAALAVQTVIREEDLIARVRRQSTTLRAALVEALGEHPHVGDIRGRGLFLGVEFVAERESKAPFPIRSAVHATFKKAAMARGLLVYPGGGCIDGQRGDHVLLAPAYTVSDDEIGQIVSRFSSALDDMRDEMAASAVSYTSPLCHAPSRPCPPTR